jgi:hypothetical protein
MKGFETRHGRGLGRGHPARSATPVLPFLSLPVHQQLDHGSSSGVPRRRALRRFRHQLESLGYTVQVELVAASAGA